MFTGTSKGTANLSLAQYLKTALGWRCIPPERPLDVRACSSSCGSLSEERRGAWSTVILGTSITCSRTGNVALKNTRTSTSCPHHLRHRSIEHRQGHNVDGLLHDAPLNPLLRTRHVEQTVWPGATDGWHLVKVLGCLPSGEWGSSGSSPCSSTRSPTPRPWLSSGPVGRYGATLQPGPLRRSSAHVATMSGAVALYAA